MDSAIANNVIIRNKILSESNQPIAPKQLLPIDDSENEDDAINLQPINQISDDMDDYAVSDTNLIDVENQYQSQNNENVVGKSSTKPMLAASSCGNKSQFSQSRIKTIMKLDPELSLTSKESVFIVSKATELFVDYISKESYKFTSQSSRKTLQRKDIEQAINTVDALYFLDSALD